MSPVTSTPLVSVYVLAYNHEPYIRESLDSALMQVTNFDFEIVIGEDHSTDATRSICMEYQQKYPEKIRLIISETNVGAFKNALRTLKACRGKYVASLEGDDYWTDASKLQKQIDFLETHPDFSICFHAVQIMYTGRPEDTHVSNAGQKPVSTLEDLAFGNFINTVSCVFRNNLVATLPDWMFKLSAADWSLNLLNAQYGSIYFMEEPMAVYRINPGSVWGNQPKEVMFQKIIHMLNVFEKEFGKERRIYFVRAKSSCYMNISNYYRGQNRKLKEFFYFYKACNTSDLYNMNYKDVLHKLKEITGR